MTLALTPAVADPLADTDEYPDVAFLARNDVPFDAQTAASMSAQLGAPIFITHPNSLSDAAANGISGLNPEVLIVAGGVHAISDPVANEAAEQCDPDCTIDRRFGIGRDETAADLAGIAADYGFDRPVLQGLRQVIGDVHVGGTVHADAITVQDTGLVSGLNADQLDGRDDYFHPDNDGSASGLDADLLDGMESTDLVPTSRVMPWYISFDSPGSQTIATSGPLSLVAECSEGDLDGQADGADQNLLIEYRSTQDDWIQASADVLTSADTHVILNLSQNDTGAANADELSGNGGALSADGYFLGQDDYHSIGTVNHGGHLCSAAGTIFMRSP